MGADRPAAASATAANCQAFQHHRHDRMPEQDRRKSGQSFPAPKSSRSEGRAPHVAFWRTFGVNCKAARGGGPVVLAILSDARSVGTGDPRLGASPETRQDPTSPRFIRKRRCILKRRLVPRCPPPCASTRHPGSRPAASTRRATSPSPSPPPETVGTSSLIRQALGRLGTIPQADRHHSPSLA